MKLEVKDNCPLNGFEPCKQFDCAWFIKRRDTIRTQANRQRVGMLRWRGFRS